MIGTVLAGVAAVAALVVSYMTFTIQQQQHAEQQRRRLAGFASKVTWWTEETAKGDGVLAIQNSGYEPMPASITFSGASFIGDITHSLEANRSLTAPSPTHDTTAHEVDIGALSSLQHQQAYADSRRPK
ncbi:hypothetical protein ACFQYP_13385 [Nonomuraea antimicrobica]